MKSTVEIDINAPREKVAALHADPLNNTKWMLDLERYEPTSGNQGMPGSTYRLVPKSGDMIFDVTVIKRDLPNELELKMKAPDVDVAVHAKLIALSPTTTKLISEEEFIFNGKTAAPDITVEQAIKSAHRQHMTDFKDFAESN